MWKKTLATVVPGVANMLGGPLGGMAANALLSFFGIESTGDKAKDEEAIAQAVDKLTPEQAIALKKIEAQLALEMKKADVDIFAIEADDRDSARKMRAALGDKDRTSSLLAVLITLGFFGSAAYVGMTDDAFANKDIVLMLVGALSANFNSVTSFFFGSSAGSRKKDIHSSINNALQNR